MAGYCEDFSMSRNARAAYESGEMPWSKWTKGAMLEAARELDQAGDKMPALEKLTAPALRCLLLENSSWHHTSSRYNATNFYRVNEDLFTWEPAEFAEAVERAQERAKQDKQEKTETAGETTQKGRFRWLTWAGTRNHPKAVEHVLERAVVTIRGRFYHVKDEKGNDVVRKMVGSNGTEFTPAA